MSVISNLTIGSTTYEIKDASARTAIGVPKISHQATAEDVAEDDSLSLGDEVVTQQATGLYQLIEGATGASVSLVDITSGLTNDQKKTIAKRYNITQGGVVVGTFDIPADKFVSTGQLYTATSEDTDLVEGNVYLRVTVNNAAGTQVDIPVQGLVDITTYKYTSNTETLTLGGLVEDNE